MKKKYTKPVLVTSKPQTTNTQPGDEKMKNSTVYIKLRLWAIVTFIACGVGLGLIAASSYLTDRGEVLPPWI